MFVNLQGGTSIGDGVDEIDSFENVIGSSYNDYITGTDGVNALFGNEGHDTLFARSGDDIMIGFSGQDSMFGGVGTADFVSYSDGNLAGLSVLIDLGAGVANRSDGNDTLDGVEMVEGSSENDSVYGDNGPNFFYSDEGDDFINGRGGSDLVFFLGAGPGGVEADLSEGTATGMNDSGPDVLNNIEHLVGSSYVDELIGDNNRNFLNGSNGVDHVVGAGNNDYISGGTGGDILEGGPGNQDMVDFFQSKNSVNLDLGTSPATATGEGNDDLFDIEAASGSKKADHFEGNSAANFFYGQKGADNLLGFGGGDHLDGGPKTDTLVGGPANDECFKKSESSSCEDFSQPDEHPLSSYSRRYKKAVAAARRYKRRYK
jgi:Ca2+-binding RTX toxin-like protein